MSFLGSMGIGGHRDSGQAAARVVTASGRSQLTRARCDELRLTILPCELGEANEFVSQYHRHHGRVVGHKFSIAVALGEQVVGVAIVSSPVSRRLDNGMTLEVTRCCTDGTKNAASALYGAVRRATFALGYKRLVTYTLNTEPGTSLVAAGWKNMGEAGGGSWSVPSRPRVDKHPLQRKIRWEAAL